MKRFGLSVFTCVALVAFMGLSASAFAVDKYDPDCTAHGPPDWGHFEVFGLNIDTPDSHVAHAVSTISGGALACGSHISGTYLAPVGWETLNDTATIKNPPGVSQAAAPGPGLALGDYVGRSQVDALGWVPFLGAQFFDNRIVVLRVDNPAGASVDCPDTALQCYRGDDRPDLGGGGPVLGHGWVWTMKDPVTKRTALTIGPFHPVVGLYSGLTQIDSIDFCKYAGTTGDACGDSSRPWLQKNGDASGIACEGDKGKYKATVTNKGGATTATRSFCVHWADRAGVPESQVHYPHPGHPGEEPPAPKDKVLLP